MLGTDRVGYVVGDSMTLAAPVATLLGWTLGFQGQPTANAGPNKANKN